MSQVSSDQTRSQRVRRFDAPRKTASRRVLDAGSGPRGNSRLHAAFAGWDQVRLDIDKAVEPDLVGTICDMSRLAADASFDAIWTSHNIEHLHAHEVMTAFREFKRVLKPDGFCLVTCPDVEAIAEAILAKGLTALAYQSSAGPITPLDMLFGHGRSIAAGNTFMCHHTGFTEASLGQVAIEAGFAEARIARGNAFDLWAVLLMPETKLEEIELLLRKTAEHYLVAQT